MQPTVNASVAAPKRRIVFISTMENLPWAGSEELWSRAALALANNGWPVAASVHNWPTLHHRIPELEQAGVALQLRNYPLWRRAQRRLFARDKAPLDLQAISFATAKPTALLLASGGPASSLGLLEACLAKNVPFATICQQNSEFFWPDDPTAMRYRRVMLAARRCYFVSNENRKLFEKQIACELPNAEIVWNPCNVDFDQHQTWPKLEKEAEVRFASVARLHPPSKGQDILLEALAGPAWRDRSWCLTFYGAGPMREGIEHLVRRFGLQDRAEFAGHVADVEKIWAKNHALVLPSRFEGMPLALVEAMLCCRAAVATDIAGQEIIVDEVTGFLANAPTASALGAALERLWIRRADLQEIGMAAAAAIRQRVPSNPVGVFVDKILALTERSYEPLG